MVERENTPEIHSQRISQHTSIQCLKQRARRLGLAFSRSVFQQKLDRSSIVTFESKLDRKQTTRYVSTFNRLADCYALRVCPTRCVPFLACFHFLFFAIYSELQLPICFEIFDCIFPEDLYDYRSFTLDRLF